MYFSKGKSGINKNVGVKNLKPKVSHTIDTRHDGSSALHVFLK